MPHHAQMKPPTETLDQLLSHLDVLEATAGFVEGYVNEVEMDVPRNDPQLQNVFRECA